MKRILVLNFYPAFYPPRSGGELRYYNVYKELSQVYDVTLLSPTYNEAKEETIVFSPTFREYRIPKEDIHNQLHWGLNQENFCSEVSALVCCLSAQYHNRYHDVYQKLYPDADIIIHETPYMLYYDMYFGLDCKPRVYNSQNFETYLVEQLWKGPCAEKYVSIIREAEKTLVQECDAVFAISEEECESFRKAFDVQEKEIYVVPNGINVSLYEKIRENRKRDDRKKAFFIGSAHPPNLEAVDFLVNTVAPACPEVDFYIAGKCCGKTTSDLPNVHLMGLIDEVQKNDLFRTSDFAVNPMFSGAGTNLKTLEFLSAGIPTISTTVGVRGLEMTEDLHYFHGEKDDFVSVLKEAMNDPEKCEAIAQNGKKHVNATYSWKSICERAHEAIENISVHKKDGRPVLLAVNDFEVDNPVAGGEVRIFNLLDNLSVQYNVILLCLNNKDIKLKKINEHFCSISLPKTEKHLQYEQNVNSKYWVSANDIVAGEMISKNELFMDVMKQLHGLCDVVILEHPYLIDCLEGLDGKPVIYESLNFEYILKKNLLEGHPMGQHLIAEAKRMEYTALQKSQQVVCCSADEVPGLQDFAKPAAPDFAVVRNGVKFSEKKYDYSVLKKSLNNRPIAVFVGSGHSPNVDAAAFIIRGLAREVPSCLFLIIGSVCDAFQTEVLLDNVVLMGRLEDRYKEYLLYAADVALNPVDQGAGSNLKLAEYFAYELPSITTTFGARGYDIQNGKHAIICERPQFAEKLNWLLQNQDACADMVQNAFLYAKEELSWENLAKKYRDVLETMFGKKKLLAITYRYNMPPRGGAEVFLNNILTEIQKNSKYSVDVVTTDIGDIMNEFHYSCSYTWDKNSTGYTLNVRKFPTDGIDQSRKWKCCHQLYDTVTQESIGLARKFLSVYERPVLMGGWHFPEVHDGGANIWSSEKAELYIVGVNSLCIKGSTHRRQPVKVLVDGQEIYHKRIHGGFTIQLDHLNGTVCTIETDPFTLKNQDPRSLGIYVNEIGYDAADGSHVLNLAFDYKQYLRSEHLVEFVESLIESAKKRDSCYDEMFQHVRGPRSTKLEEWLENNISKYDVVIGHSTPFATLVMGQKIAVKYNVPYIALPHYHMEDMFYHWNSYYNALKNADCVIAAPEVSKEIFFDKIGANAKALPGGGIFMDEFQKIDTEAFQKVYTDKTPFVLVLGRKAGGKNYEWVVEAVEEINRRGCPLKMVMVGRNDDHREISSDYLTYLGEQPREVVLGALKCCDFVVNMSESESFGIVILEAWLAGKTVVVNQRCAAFAELVQNGENGILATRENLADEIQNLFQREDKQLLAENGAHKALNYSWQHIAMEIQSMCDNLSVEA